MSEESKKPSEPTPDKKPAAAKPAAAAKPKVPARIQVSWGEIGKKVKDKFDCFPQPTVSNNIEAFLLKNKAQLSDLMSYAKDELGFEVLLLINIVEYKECFQIIYQLQKVDPYSIICIKVNLDKNEETKVESLTPLWESANWFEREMWDMHGIVFENHPKLERLLNPDNWKGFPLRKDYVPQIDALNGPITAVKGGDIGQLEHGVRGDVEVIEEPNKPAEKPQAEEAGDGQ